jgi:hypothetical protein
MLQGDHALGQIVRPRPIGAAPVGYRQRTAREVPLEPGLRHAPAPPVALPVAGTFRLRHVRRRERAPRAHGLQHPLDVGRVPRHEGSEGARAPVVLHAIAQQRPALDPHDGSLAGPLLGELAPPVDEIVEERRVVGAEPRERHQVLRRQDDVDVVDLQEAEPAERAPEKRGAHPAAWARAIEALRPERDAARLAERQLVHGGRPSFVRSGMYPVAATPPVPFQGGFYRCSAPRAGPISGAARRAAVAACLRRSTWAEACTERRPSDSEGEPTLIRTSRSSGLHDPGGSRPRVPGGHHPARTRRRGVRRRVRGGLIPQLGRRRYTPAGARRSRDAT